MLFCPNRSQVPAIVVQVGTFSFLFVFYYVGVFWELFEGTERMFYALDYLKAKDEYSQFLHFLDEDSEEDGKEMKDR